MTGGRRWLLVALLLLPGCMLGLRYEVEPEDCSGGRDEDLDGLVDCADPDCVCDESADGINCRDGLDNDLDGVADGMDPGCWKVSVNRCSSVPGTALGPEATEVVDGWLGPVEQVPDPLRPGRVALASGQRGATLRFGEVTAGAYGGTALRFEVHRPDPTSSLTVSLRQPASDGVRVPDVEWRWGPGDRVVLSETHPEGTNAVEASRPATGGWMTVALDLHVDRLVATGGVSLELPLPRINYGESPGYALEVSADWGPDGRPPLLSGLALERPPHEPCDEPMPFAGVEQGLVAWTATVDTDPLRPLRRAAGGQRAGDEELTYCLVVATPEGARPTAVRVDYPTWEVATTPLPATLGDPVLTFADGRFLLAGRLAGGPVELFESRDCVTFGERLGPAFADGGDPANALLFAASRAGEAYLLWFREERNIVFARAAAWEAGAFARHPDDPERAVNVSPQSVERNFSRPIMSLSPLGFAPVWLDAFEYRRQGMLELDTGSGTAAAAGAAITALGPSGRPGTFDAYAAGPGVAVHKGELDYPSITLFYSARACADCPLRLGVARVDVD